MSTSVTKESTSKSNGSKDSKGSNGSKDSHDSTDSKSKKTAGDYFLDHLGNIFLSAIAMVVLALVRSSKGSSNRTALRGSLERDAALDPAEIDDLRVANSELDRGVFETIVDNLLEDLRVHGGGGRSQSGGSGSYAAIASGMDSFDSTGGGNDDAHGNPNGGASSPLASTALTMTYPEFVSRVMQIMKKLKGEEYTIQMGHLIDRVVLTAVREHAAERRAEHGHKTATDDDDAHHTDDDAPLDLSFLLAVLSLALRTPTVRDRIEVLFDVVHRTQTHSDNDRGDGKDEGGTETTEVVSTAGVTDMVGYLQRTSQLVADTQIVEDATKYPFQLYRRGTPDELVAMGTAMKKDSLSEGALLGGGNGGEGGWTCDDFHHILRSRSVCAWGECYTKKKGLH